MGNWDLDATWSYHDGTKHTPFSIHSDPHFLDFANQPLPFKIYTELEPIPLPKDFPESGTPALEAVATSGGSEAATYVPDLRTLAGLFHHSAGITRRGVYPGGEILFRAAACTGALYHIELYLVCGDLPGLPAGIYHFAVHDFALRRLRDGDYRSVLTNASGREPDIAEAPATIVCTGTYWRNSWKYRSRTYRHCFWDSGTILANLLAMASGYGMPAKAVAGFVDGPVNELLGLDTHREVALNLVPIGRTSGLVVPPAPEVTPLSRETRPLSAEEVDYPPIREMHAASSLEAEDAAEAWRGGTPAIAWSDIDGEVFPLADIDLRAIAPEPVEKVIARRGSTRQFVHRSITFEQLSAILYSATRGVEADFLEPPGAMLNTLYLMVHAVEGIPQGSYVFDCERDALLLLERGDLRREARYLGLQQALPGDASVDIFFLVDLKPVLERYGNRGYRAAQLEAGIIGGRLYLGAYAQRLGASGLTFFDDDVSDFFSPHAAGKSVMFLVALGVPLRKRVVKK